MRDEPLQLVSERTLAKRLGLSVRTLQSWRQRDEGPPFFKLGASVRYDVGEAEEWLRSTQGTYE